MREWAEKKPNIFHLSQENEGDCDIDSDCNGDLKCGKDNCPGTNFHAMADCCYKQSKKKNEDMYFPDPPSSCGFKGVVGFSSFWVCRNLFAEHILMND